MEVILFYSAGCSNCHALIEELGNSDFFNTINYKKIDIHTDSAMAHDYHIYVVPTVVLLNKKKIIWRYAGVNAAAFYIENIKKYL